MSSSAMLTLCVFSMLLFAAGDFLNAPWLKGAGTVLAVAGLYTKIKPDKESDR